MSAAKLLAALAIASAALSASATTYYWKPGATQGLWSTLSNWSTESVDGAAATTLPSPSDSLAGNYNYNFDLEDNSYTLSHWETPSDWDQHYMTLANGSLTFTLGTSDGMSTHGGTIAVNAGGSLIFPSTSKFQPGLYSSSPINIIVNNGGAVSIAGHLRIYNCNFSISSGGNLELTPSFLRLGAEAHNYSLSISNAGTLSLPKGFAFDCWDTASVNSGTSYAINQTAGTLNLGGPICNAPDSDSSKPGMFDIRLSGGTVHVMSNASFNVTSVYLENTVTFNVDSGKTISLANVTFAPEASIAKSGDGAIILQKIAQKATISAGSIALTTSETYDLSAVTFESGSAIALIAMGARLDTASASIENATFTATIPAIAGTDVLFSSNSDILNKAKEDLPAPSGFELVIKDGALTVEAKTAGSFTSSGDITDPNGWGGSVPADGMDVSIAGANVVATLPNGKVLPAWKSIEVKDGATLRIEASSTLPTIVLNRNATLEIGNNAVATLTNITDLIATAATSPSIVLPTLTIESGATLNVPGGMKFKNVNVRHFGTIAATSGGRMHFGYAAANETAYFAMCSTNATILTLNTGNYGDGTPCFVTPEANGTVHVSGTIELDGLTLTREKPGKTSIYDAVMVGVNNPVDAPFAVLFNNFTMAYRGYADFGGAATVTFRDSNLTKPEWQAWSSQGRWNVNDLAKVIFENTEHYYEYPDGNSVGWFPSSAETESFVLTNSTVMWSRPTGNYNGKMTVYDSFYDCAYDAYITNQVYNDEYIVLPDLMTGLGTLDIREGSFFAIRAKNHVFWDANDDAPERRCKVDSNLSIIGAGDLIITNAVSGRYFEVIMQSANNTCTGRLRVDSPEGYDAKLYFANGANWAGTVTAGNFATTNLVDATAACTNSFGTLDLAAGSELKLRVRKTNGTIVSHDGLNVGTYVNNGGRIVLEAMDESLMPGDTLVIGTIGEDSPMPAMAGHWRTERDANDYLRVKYSVGLSVIIR